MRFRAFQTKGISMRTGKFQNSPVWGREQLSKTIKGRAFVLKPKLGAFVRGEKVQEQYGVERNKKNAGKAWRL